MFQIVHKNFTKVRLYFLNNPANKNRLTDDIDKIAITNKATKIRQFVSRLMHFAWCLEGYYRELMAASTLSNAEDTSEDHQFVESELLIAIGIGCTCVAALSVAGIALFIVWRWCRNNKTTEEESQ